jgi:Glyoxalase-like domain
MTARLDHLTVVAPSLEVGSAYVEAALGVAPGAGRTHPGMATHNLLLALGADVYLEVIAPDPKAAPIDRPRWFGLDAIRPRSKARLGAWVASTDDIVNASVPAIGEVETMRREAHTWQMTIRADGSPPLDGAAPLLIQRASSAHPAAALPRSGLQLRRLRIRHPAPDEVIGLLARIGIASQPAIAVTRADACSLVAEIQTPAGVRELGEG